MKTSESIDLLAAALAAAQANIKPAKKDSQNPHLNNKYASLDSIIEAVRGPLAQNGIAILQPIGERDEQLVLRTILLHESGQWIESTIALQLLDANRGANALQALGATLTYYRRYALSAFLGIATGEDVDGNDAPAARQTQQRAAKDRAATRENGSNNRPLPADKLAAYLHKRAEAGSNDPPSDGQLKLLNWKLKDALGDEEARRTVLHHLFRVESSAALTKGQASAIISWLVKGEGDTALHPAASQEAAALAEAAYEAPMDEPQMDPVDVYAEAEDEIEF